MNLWYVIQTKLRKEGEAASYLGIKGVEIFNPLAETFSHKNGRMIKGLRPLFPNYIFGRFDIDREYNLVKWGRGVSKIVGFGEYPVSISEEAIELIRKRTDDHGIVKKNSHFEPNDAVRIKSGPLRDLSGVFERWVSEGERVRILISLIGYQPALELHYSLIEKVA
jgi:transcriptional antiterminator RfaH